MENGYPAINPINNIPSFSYDSVTLPRPPLETGTVKQPKDWTERQKYSQGLGFQWSSLNQLTVA
ncbi:hypothetical protein AKJ66_02570 [candidate division MSBL1 archaeon SCGC-AAA259E22]|uniref:Uncharacterized protein n=1 Tax=candidate division MSBL1 archaeon SCGC-AAA259E22 TaxID=1698265 RepID=A0A133UGF4_9EURY|nr:hypothetical protein AKJ66_02570 [candidate division MSBL1 archaeon SCGC-AAA259E22]